MIYREISSAQQDKFDVDVVAVAQNLLFPNLYRKMSASSAPSPRVHFPVATYVKDNTFTKYKTSN